MPNVDRCVSLSTVDPMKSVVYNMNHARHYCFPSCYQYVYFEHFKLPNFVYENNSTYQTLSHSLDWPDHRRCMCAYEIQQQFLPKNPVLWTLQWPEIQEHFQSKGKSSLYFNLLGYANPWELFLGNETGCQIGKQKFNSNFHICCNFFYNYLSSFLILKFVPISSLYICCHFWF